RIGLAGPARQVGGVERVGGEVRALRHLRGGALVLRPAIAELDPGEVAAGAHVELAVDLRVFLLVARLAGAGAEDPVERRAGERRRVAARERDVGGGAQAVEAVAGA